MRIISDSWDINRILAYWGLTKPLSLAGVVSMVATPQFKILQSIFLFAYGLKEWSWNGCTPVEDSQRERATQTFYRTHGILYWTSGIAGLYRERLPATLMNADSVLFLSACVTGLCYNIARYRNAAAENATPEEKKSAILGIISNLNYIIGGALNLIGVAASTALVLCCIALTTGAIKILYDYFMSQAI